MGTKVTGLCQGIILGKNGDLETKIYFGKVELRTNFITSLLLIYSPQVSACKFLEKKLCE